MRVLVFTSKLLGAWPSCHVVTDTPVFTVEREDSSEIRAFLFGICTGEVPIARLLVCTCVLPSISLVRMITPRRNKRCQTAAGIRLSDNFPAHTRPPLDIHQPRLNVSESSRQPQTLRDRRCEVLDTDLVSHACYAVHLPAYSSSEPYAGLLLKVAQIFDPTTLPLPSPL